MNIKIAVQISPGAWYIGVFNGFGAARTQSRMVWLIIQVSLLELIFHFAYSIS